MVVGKVVGIPLERNKTMMTIARVTLTVAALALEGAMIVCLIGNVAAGNWEGVGYSLFALAGWYSAK